MPAYVRQRPRDVCLQACLRKYSVLRTEYRGLTIRALYEAFHTPKFIMVLLAR